MKQAINSIKAPGAIGPYSQAIEAAGMTLPPAKWPKVPRHRHASPWKT